MINVSGLFQPLVIQGKKTVPLQVKVLNPFKYWGDFCIGRSELRIQASCSSTVSDGDPSYWLTSSITLLIFVSYVIVKL